MKNDLMTVHPGSNLATLNYRTIFIDGVYLIPLKPHSWKQYCFFAKYISQIVVFCEEYGQALCMCEDSFAFFTGRKLQIESGWCLCAQRDIARGASRRVVLYRLYSIATDMDFTLLR
jgi:hypothetical protein